MFSGRCSWIREKRFRTPQLPPSTGREDPPATLTEDSSLFLLNQFLERRAKIESLPWWRRLLRRR